MASEYPRRTKRRICIPDTSRISEGQAVTGRDACITSQYLPLIVYLIIIAQLEADEDGPGEAVEVVADHQGALLHRDVEAIFDTGSKPALRTDYGAGAIHGGAIRGAIRPRLRDRHQHQHRASDTERHHRAAVEQKLPRHASLQRQRANPSCTDRASRGEATQACVFCL
jgi:hypothetical protein